MGFHIVDMLLQGTQPKTEAIEEDSILPAMAPQQPGSLMIIRVMFLL